ncbi:hypothetical protein QFZ76_000611 [Streptomyces sp. V4I2]|nr:hypothetical protein [Streptomyces sp. V4I2]
MPTDPKDVVRAFVDALNRQDWDRVGGLITPDFSEFLRGTPGVYAREESHPRGCGAERRSITVSARPGSGRVMRARGRLSHSM